MRRIWPIVFLGGCVYPALQPEDLCAEVVHAAALRTLECTGDTVLANARGEAMAALECLATSVDEELWACPRAVYAAPCPEVETLGDEVGYWLGSDPHCPLILEQGAGGGGQVWDIPAWDGFLSCENPPFITVLGSENAIDEWFSVGIGDSAAFAPSCLPPVPTRDLVMAVSWDDSGAPLAVWASVVDLTGVAVSVLTGGDTCATAREEACAPAPEDGSWVELTRGPGLGGMARALFVWSLPDPQAEGTVRLAVRPAGTGPPP